VIFTVIETPRGKLVQCEIDGEVGAARVFSAGETEARQRAEAQARQKIVERDARGPAE
jgi:hypothetical protein